MTKSENIEKIFYQDSFAKKKIGRGAHNKVSRGEKAKSSNFWRGGFKAEKPYDKNSKTMKNNIYENICSLESFNQYDEETRVNMLQTWVNMFTLTEIKENMGIGDMRLKKLLNKYEISKDDNMIDHKKLYQELMSSENLDGNKFKRLSPKYKYQFLEEFGEKYNKNIKEIADLLGKPEGSLRSQKSTWKKMYEQEMEDEDDNDIDDDIYDKLLISGMGKNETKNESPDYDNKEVSNYNQEPEEEETTQKDTAFKVTREEEPSRKIKVSLNGKFEGSEASRNLKSLSEMLESYGNVSIELEIEV